MPDNEESDEDENEDEEVDVVDVTSGSHRPSTQSTAQSGGWEWDKEYVIEAFLLNTAGMPVQTNMATATDYSRYKQNVVPDNIYAPFASRLDWEIARWAKSHGTTSAAVSELLKIPGVNHN